MKGFMKKGAVIMAAGMLLTGCGEEMTALTESEEAVIVNYSAGMVGKFNKRQMDGLTAVVPKEEELVSQEEEQIQEEPIQEEQTQEQQTQEQQTQEQEENPGTSQQEEPEMSLTQILGIPGVEFAYTGYELSNNYEESDYFSMAAPEGSTYFVMKYTITNTGSAEAACDILSRKAEFTLSLNGAPSCRNEVTMLPNDLSTYMADLAPGETAEAVLIFEVPIEQTAEITSVQAEVQIDGIRGNATM